MFVSFDLKPSTFCFKNTYELLKVLKNALNLIKVQKYFSRSI